MDFDEHEEAEDEIGMQGYYRSLANSGRPKTNELGGASVNRKHAAGGRYRECLKNHAVGIGGHAVDGCGEFMAAGEDGTLDALRCAACSCHRNFHRKELPSGADTSLLTSPLTQAAGYFHPPFSPYYRMPAGYLHHHHHVVAADQRPATLALPSTSGGGGSCKEEHEDGSNMAGLSSSSAKKRHRTKFTQEQKDKMQAFAEKVGWRIQKHDEADVDRFCNETSVKRNVFKVWMHNNKLCTLGKKLPSPPLGQLPH